MRKAVLIKPPVVCVRQSVRYIWHIHSALIRPTYATLRSENLSTLILFRDCIRSDDAAAPLTPGHDHIGTTCPLVTLRSSAVSGVDVLAAFANPG